MSFACHLYVICIDLHVIYMYSYVIRMSLACSRMSSVCHSYALVCHPYVACMYSYVIRMSLVCTRMSSICHSYVLVCHPYVTRMRFYHEPSNIIQYSNISLLQLTTCYILPIVKIKEH